MHGHAHTLWRKGCGRMYPLESADARPRLVKSSASSLDVPNFTPLEALWRCRLVAGGARRGRGRGRRQRAPDSRQTGRQHRYPANRKGASASGAYQQPPATCHLPVATCCTCHTLAAACCLLPPATCHLPAGTFHLTDGRDGRFNPFAFRVQRKKHR